MAELLVIAVVEPDHLRQQRPERQEQERPERPGPGHGHGQDRKRGRADVGESEQPPPPGITPPAAVAGRHDTCRREPGGYCLTGLSGALGDDPRTSEVRHLAPFPVLSVA